MKRFLLAFALSLTALAQNNNPPIEMTAQSPNGQFIAIGLDISGNVLMNAGGSSGQTTVVSGYVPPAAMTATDPNGNAIFLKADGNGNLFVNCQVGCGNGGSGNVLTAAAFSPAYYASVGTIISGATPFIGIGFFSTTAPPVAATGAQIVSIIGPNVYDAAGSAINPTSIGATTPGTGAFTTVTASSGFLVIPDGTHAQYSYWVGNTANQAVVANSFGIMGPASASFTPYAVQFSSTAPSNSTPILSCGTPSSSVSACTWVAAGTSITWPTSTDLVISNGTTSPAGLAPVNGDCVVGSGSAWTAGACGSSVTFPTSADLVISNGTSSPAGLAPVNGDCVLGSGGAWTAGSCGSSTPAFSAITTGTSTVALTIGTSGSLTTSGSGTITATAVPWSGITAGTNTATGVFATAGTWTFSAAGAASTPGLSITGAPYTGGSTTTNFPQLYINDGTGPTTFSANGTAFGINVPTGFTGLFLDFHLNGGSSLFNVNFGGGVTMSGSLQAAGILDGIAIQTGSAEPIGFSSTTSTNGTRDTIICRGAAAGVLAFESAATCTNTTAAGNAGISATTVFVGTTGVAGTVVFGNATSGTVTVGTVAGALGAVTASLPANTGTIAELNLAQTWTATQSFTTINATTHNVGSTGVAGTAVFGNATSGTITLGTVAGALGAVTASLPANTGTIAELNLAQTWTATQTFTTPALGAATATSLVATGIIDGLAPVTITTSTTGTPGATNSSGYTINHEATAATAVTYTLPTAAAGKQYCVKNGNNGSAADTGILTIQVSAAGQSVVFNGTAGASNGNLVSGGAAGDAACVVGISATQWEAYAQVGTWTVH